VVDTYQVFRARLSAPGRPVGNLLFLGPTGSAKTRVVEVAAEILFGHMRVIIKIDCAEYQHSHEIAKLIGSPPGYLGHRETYPLIAQMFCRRQLLTRHPIQLPFTLSMRAFGTRKIFPEVLAVTGVEVTS